MSDVVQGPHSDAWSERGDVTMTARTDKPDGAYLDVWGPLSCRHCGRVWGGSMVSGKGVALGGYALHPDCYPAAVQILVATQQLGGRR